jgi:hypothetical protein
MRAALRVRVSVRLDNAWATKADELRSQHVLQRRLRWYYDPVPICVVPGSLYAHFGEEELQNQLLEWQFERCDVGITGHCGPRRRRLSWQRRGMGHCRYGGIFFIRRNSS